jgi:hypothetical protein
MFVFFFSDLGQTDDDDSQGLAALEGVLAALEACISLQWCGNFGGLHIFAGSRCSHFAGS